MEILEEEGRVKIEACFLPKDIYDRLLNGNLDTPQIEIEKDSSFEVQSHPQDFEKVSLLEVNLEQEDGLRNLSESELAKKGIILVKRYKLVNRLDYFIPFYPQTRERMEGQDKNYAWVRIEKI